MRSGKLRDELRLALLDAFRTPGEMKILVDYADLGVTFVNFLAADGASYDSALFALLQLVHVYQLVKTPELVKLFGSGPLNAQIELLLDSFRSDWSMSLVIFGIHLILLGYLIYRSRYIPKVLGILLVIDGVGWEIDSLRPYLYRNAHLGWLFITFLGELVFMLWLLIGGWKIQEPTARFSPTGASSNQ